MAHGPVEYNERSSLLRNERRVGNDDRREHQHRSPSQLSPRVVPSQRRPSEPKPVLKLSDIIHALLALLILAALATGVIFFLWLAASGLFHLVAHALSNVHWPHWRSQPEPPYVRKIAIIGAGPGGSSAAYNIQSFAHQKGILVDITVYEKNDYIGGRTTYKVQVNGQAVQIAANGFHKSNKNLVDAVEGLELTPVMVEEKGDTGAYWGIYDGSEFVYRQTDPSQVISSWWWHPRILHTYGYYSPQKTHSLITETVSKFSNIYSPKFFPFTSLSTVIKDLGLEDATSLTGQQLLTNHGIGELFQKDFLNAWTRREFGQNLGQISGFGMTMSPDDGGYMTVEEGHEALFERMVNVSKAEVMLNTTVLGVRKMDWGGWIVASEGEKTDSDGLDFQQFDSVILAAPYQLARLEIKGDRLDYIPDELEYASAHVTLFTSSRKLSSSFFGIRGEVPETIMTTLSAEEMEEIGRRTGSGGVGYIGFYSVTILKRISRRIQGVRVDEYLYKIVSPEKLEDKIIHELFGTAERDKDVVSWVYRHEFPSAYPYIYPRRSFAGSLLEKNFWYTSGIEELSSNMELSSLMGSNIAKLVVGGWMKEGKKGKRPPPPEESKGDGGEGTPSLTLGEYLRQKYEGII